MKKHMNGPELVFGLVGPIGADMECIIEELTSSLQSVGYKAYPIHITSILPMIFNDGLKNPTLKEKIELANTVRKSASDNSILAAISIAEIKRVRGVINKENSVTPLSDKTPLTEIPLNSSAYIIRQLKREEEIRVLRKVYGDSFIQISVAINEDKQFSDVVNIVSRQEASLSESERKKLAHDLIETDKQELSNTFGQRMLDAYQSADFFVTGETRGDISKSIQRFIRALFGHNHVSPTKDEFGAMVAKTASLRSVDLSRQVGAAIVNERGDILSLGCNEVPSAGGGQYWGDDNSPARDIELGVDSNKVETTGIIEGFIKLLEKSGALVENYRDILGGRDYLDGLKGTAISDLTEFGRITHAEMSAVTEAARLGRSLQGATMHVTTFPCHNCAKHIVASGVSRIVYIEPYAKSRALQLHKDSITNGSVEGRKVKVEHFRGISPRRFKELFEKGKRKDKNHMAQTWYHGVPMPILYDKNQFHTKAEISVVGDAFAKIEKIRTDEATEAS